MIHQYKMNGYNIVLDVNSGCVHVVDDVAYDIIALFEDTPREQIASAMAEKYPDVSAEDIGGILDDVAQMKADGTLFSEDIYADIAFDFKARSTVVKALCLHVTHDCNLACRYCFAEEGEYHGQRALMSFEVGKQALDFLIANSGHRTNLEVDFFGGEPLMNWKVVKQLVEYGRSREAETGKKFRFTVTTNGVLLNDEMMDFINQEMHNVVLSIDGRKQVNDFMRPFRNGKGSYDLILPKFKKMAESRDQQQYYVRGTYTHHNLDFAEDVLHLADEGFEQISVEPVVAPNTADYAIQEADIPQLCAEYEKLAEAILARRKAGEGFNFFHFMIDLSGGPCVYKRISGCGAGTEYLAITPWGDLYPCHQFVGNTDFLLGNVKDGVVNTALRDQFKMVNVYAKDTCKDCFSKFHCSGGCAANAYNFTGDICKPYEIGCELQRKRLECALMIKAAEADQGE
ncbi:MAG: thioether cross-link-forming SCIFF peptide maturase [Clostridia bacterium]|nr:thioether cross-link-forming SCIFF peptide maturase [Clostridia bacterium]